MKCILKVTIPVESGNEAAKDGTMGQTINSILEDLKPEAVYFMAENGCRAGHIYFDMEDPSRIPSVVEPWFLAFNATVEIQPVMVPEDLAKAGGDIGLAVEKYSG